MNNPLYRLIKSGMTGIKRRITGNEKTYLAARLGKGVFRDGFGETVKRYRIYSYEEIVERDAAGDPLLLYSEREKLRTRNPAPDKICVMALFGDSDAKVIPQFINSFLVQSSPNWKLILLDQNDVHHTEASVKLRKSAARHRKISYRKTTPKRGTVELMKSILRKEKAAIFVFLSQDDLIHPNALLELDRWMKEKNADLVYTDETTIDKNAADAHDPFYKPEYGPDTLRSYNYIGTFFAARKEVIRKAVSEIPDEQVFSLYDMILRLSESACHIVRIPEILCYFRNTAEKAFGHMPFGLSYAEEEIQALTRHLARTGLRGTVLQGPAPSTYRIDYEIRGKPLVSIVIPNMDHVEELRICINSLMEKTTWQELEIIIVENNSRKKETFEYYDELQKDPSIRVITWNATFHYAKVCNFGASVAKGDYILLLNNDTEVISPDWIKQMMMFAQREDVGAVGAKLLYQNQTVQHAGVIIDPVFTVFHYLRNLPESDPGYADRLLIVQNLTACTGACLLVSAEKWKEVNGLDEDFAMTYNDIDLCMRLRQKGYLIVWTPFAELYHHELKTRGDNDTDEKVNLARREEQDFRKKWKNEIEKGDPYYNPNLIGNSLSAEGK